MRVHHTTMSSRGEVRGIQWGGTYLDPADFAAGRPKGAPLALMTQLLTMPSIRKWLTRSATKVDWIWPTGTTPSKQLAKRSWPVKAEGFMWASFTGIW